MAVFVAVVDGGSLSAASRQLRTPLATVSRRIADLEAQLHTRLLQRSTRKLSLTDAGADYLAACRRILDDVAETESAAAGEYTAPRGELVVSAPIVFGRLHMVPVVSEFLAAYPEVDLRLQFGDRQVNLLDDHVDLALRVGTLPDSTLIARPLGATREVVCGAPAYFAQKRAPRQPRDLASHACITFAGLASAKAWRFRNAGAETTVPVHSRLIVDSADAALGAAIAGAGVTRALSYQIADAVRAAALRVVLSKFELAPRPVHLVYARQGRLPLKLRAFIDFAEPRLRERLIAASLD